MQIPKYIHKRADFICLELGIIDSEHQPSAVRLAIIKEYKNYYKNQYKSIFEWA